MLPVDLRAQVVDLQTAAEMLNLLMKGRPHGEEFVNFLKVSFLSLSLFYECAFHISDLHAE